MHGSARCLPPLAAVALLTLLFGPGCTRHDFRQRADKDVEGVISQKNIFPDWQVKSWHVYPDPRARFADNSNPDRPPYPPDDYAARLLSPNPQHPTKKSGVGRVDGDGYVSLLQKWDAENRAWDPVPAGGGAAAVARPTPAAPPPAVTAQVAPAKPVAAEKPWMAAPTVVQGERPAVRHRLPGSAPAALRPAGGTPPATATEPHAVPTVQPAVAKTPGPGDFGPWVAARPSMSIPGPVVTDRGNGPTITELRPPVVIVIAGEVEQNGKMVPAVGLFPLVEQPVVPPPEKIAPPQPLPAGQPVPPVPVPPVVGPMPLDPKAPDPGKPGDPVGKGGDGLGPLGDPAADYLRALETAQVGYRIRLEQAVELGVINGREFQDRREDLYLTALPVTLARFNFAAQAFFTEQVVRQSTGRELANGGERWTLNTTGGVNKLFPTGAQLMAKLANQVVVDLSGNKPTTAVSNLSLSLAQPFLRGGGYAVTLENLTQNERTLLYAIRSYARFRKVFYVAIAAGPTNLGYTNNPYGLQGLAPNLGRGIGANLTANAVGYLPLLQQQSSIDNQRRNVAALEKFLKLYQAFREGGSLSDLQVGQVEGQLLNSRVALLNGAGGNNPGIRQYFDTLDNFKLQLGLPVTVALELDDTPLRPIRQQLNRFDELFAQVQAVEVAAAKYDRAEPVAAFRKRWLALFTESPLVRGTPFAKQIGERWAAWGPDKLNDAQRLDRWKQLRDQRRKLLEERADREARNQNSAKKEPEPPGESARLAALTADIELGEFEEKVREYEAQPWAKKTGKERDTIQDSAFAAAYNSFYLIVLEARNDRLTALYRAWPELAPLPVAGIDVRETSLDDAYTAAIQAALTNRLDLMNARAQVVDAWRQIAVTANSLQGVFDVRYDLNSSTAPGGTNPFGFSADRSSHQLTFNAQLPLVRRAERNNYRAALISYQRQRRTLMAFEDNIATDVRGDVRELRTLGQLYRIQQRVVEIQYAQVDNAQAILFAPPIPGSGSDAGSAAALTQQLLSAQSNLVNAQNGLYQIWVSYLTARMSFYLDLEQMTLDDRGVWNDELLDRTDRQDRPELRKPGERLHAPVPVGNGPG